MCSFEPMPRRAPPAPPPQATRAEWAPSPPARDPQASAEPQQLGVPTPRRVRHIRRRRGGGGAERRVGVGVGVQRRRLPQGEEEGHVLAGLEEQPVARGA